MYQKLGLDKVQVHADIDVGGYAWAKYGYVPERGSWPNLRGDLDYEIDKLSSGGGSGDAAGSWDDLPSSNQSKIEGAWMRSTRSEFLDSEINNWRDGGQPLDDAKAAVAEDFNKGGTMDWAEHAIAGYRKSREEQGQSEIPFTDEQILNAVSLNYDTGGGDGRGDLEVQFVDHKLTNPTGHDPAQETLPGIPPVAPHERLTPEMRDGLTSVIDKAFDREAEHKADDIEPPDYLSDSVEEYQGEYWDQMDDREKYRWAEDNASDFLTVSGGVEGTGEMSADDAERLRKLTQSNDPKALWAIADSKYGKKLLLGTDWYGALNLKDKETMDRFNAYVGKAKAKPA
jgi:hypothetical protein